MIAAEPFELEAEGDGTGVIRGDAEVPEGARTGVIICHGFKGFARWGFFPRLGERLTSAGLAAVSFDFSGSGIGPDRESCIDLAVFEANTYGRELRDVARVRDEATRRGWIGERWGLFGHSRGGGVAILHASRDAGVRALATWAAIAGVDRWSMPEIRRWRERGFHEVLNARTGQRLRLGLGLLEEVEREKHGSLDILRAAALVRVPWLIVHGTADEAVAFEDAGRLAAAAGSEDARLLAIEDGGHTLGATHPLDDTPAPLARALTATVEHFARAL